MDPPEPAEYILVRNIPAQMRSCDVRRFFSEWVETDRFQCFHYRHRPEVKTTRIASGDAPAPAVSETCCSLVRLAPERVGACLQRYHGQHWTDERGVDTLSKCLIQRVKLVEGSASGGSEEPTQLARADLDRMLELKPPHLMPQGNVGTPTRFFQDAIRACRLPTSLIGQLKLEFPQAASRRKYGSVPMNYGHTPVGGHFAARSRSRESQPRVEPPAEDSEDDNDTCEEWERHEALHNDVAARRADPTDISQQPGTKERLFEEEMEVTWDKGSSGLVFYTDAQYWQAQKGDFDEQTTDDWDVDMEIYYGSGDGGDKDAKDSLAMRQSVFRRQGQDLKSVFGDAKRSRKGNKVCDDNVGGPIGSFERHSKGFGRKIMERQGWKDGQGLGTTYPGIPDALGNEGQTDKSGLGYHGETISRFVTPKAPGRQRESIRDVIISTKYDNPEQVDPAEPLLRTNPQNYLSHRFKKPKPLV